MKKVALFFCFISFVSSFYALNKFQELEVASIFSDNMVLQRNTKVAVWGKAVPQREISVIFKNQQKKTISDDNGNWKIFLNPLKASTKSDSLIISSTKKIIFKNVVVGDVWICSGQSNMQMSYYGIKDIEALTKNVKNIRSFEVKRTVSFKEEKVLQGGWQVTNPTSAVAFSFAYHLEKLTNVPVGIIHTSWGSSSLEAWMPKEMQSDLAYFKNIIQNFEQDSIRINRIKSIINKDKWSNVDDIYLRRQPNILYNAMLHPLIPFTCKGLVWYQGERNTRYLSGVPNVNNKNWFHEVIGMKEYGDVLAKWIVKLRKKWQNTEMEFLVVMLPGHGRGVTGSLKIDPEDPSEKSWAFMRESQLKVTKLNNTNVINTIDLGDVKNIHPKDKLPIGKRLALTAAKNIGIDVVASGPIMTKVKQKNNRLIVYFRNAKVLATVDNNKPTGFWIANDDLVWEKADAKIKRGKVILKSESIKNPKYVRYAFSGKPSVNLINEAGLPTYPFRTK